MALVVSLVVSERWVSGSPRRAAPSLAEAGHLFMAVVTAVPPGRVVLRDATLILEITTMTDDQITLRAVAGAPAQVHPAIFTGPNRPE